MLRRLCHGANLYPVLDLRIDKGQERAVTQPFIRCLMRQSVDIFDWSSIDEINCAIGSLLRERRVKMNISQQVLALKLGVARQYISAYETGRQCIDTDELSKVLAVFNETPAQFFTQLVCQIYLRTGK